MAKNMYPEVKWVLSLPSQDILDEYGDGYLLRGSLGDCDIEYFILIEDPRIKNWIQMIVVQLKDELDGRLI